MLSLSLSLSRVQNIIKYFLLVSLVVGPTESHFWCLAFLEILRGIYPHLPRTLGLKGPPAVSCVGDELEVIVPNTAASLSVRHYPLQGLKEVQIDQNCKNVHVFKEDNRSTVKDPNTKEVTPLEYSFRCGSNEIEDRANLGNIMFMQFDSLASRSITFPRAANADAEKGKSSKLFDVSKLDGVTSHRLRTPASALARTHMAITGQASHVRLTINRAHLKCKYLFKSVVEVDVSIEVEAPHPHHPEFRWRTYPTKCALDKLKMAIESSFHQAQHREAEVQNLLARTTWHLFAKSHTWKISCHVTIQGGINHGDLSKLESELKPKLKQELKKEGVEYESHQKIDVVCKQLHTKHVVENSKQEDSGEEQEAGGDVIGLQQGPSCSICGIAYEHDDLSIECLTALAQHKMGKIISLYAHHWWAGLLWNAARLGAYFKSEVPPSPKENGYSMEKSLRYLEREEATILVARLELVSEGRGVRVLFPTFRKVDHRVRQSVLVDMHFLVSKKDLQEYKREVKTESSPVKLQVKFAIRRGDIKDGDRFGQWSPPIRLNIKEDDDGRKKSEEVATLYAAYSPGGGIFHKREEIAKGLEKLQDGTVMDTFDMVYEDQTNLLPSSPADLLSHAQLIAEYFEEESICDIIEALGAFVHLRRYSEEVAKIFAVDSPTAGKVRAKEEVAEEAKRLRDGAFFGEFEHAYQQGELKHLPSSAADLLRHARLIATKADKRKGRASICDIIRALGAFVHLKRNEEKPPNTPSELADLEMRQPVQGEDGNDVLSQEVKSDNDEFKANNNPVEPPPPPPGTAAAAAAVVDSGGATNNGDDAEAGIVQNPLRDGIIQPLRGEHTQAEATAKAEEEAVEPIAVENPMRGGDEVATAAMRWNKARESVNTTKHAFFETFHQKGAFRGGRSGAGRGKGKSMPPPGKGGKGKGKGGAPPPPGKGGKGKGKGGPPPPPGGGKDAAPADGEFFLPNCPS